MEFFLDHLLPDGQEVYHGNMSLHVGATPHDHRQVRSAFLGLMKARCPGFRFHAILHITRHRGQRLCEAHYDFTGYSPADLDAAVIRETVRDVWLEAGGKRSTCRPLSASGFHAWSKYSSKDTIRGNKWKFLPTRKQEFRLRITFGSRGFWGRAYGDVYRAWIDSWKVSRYVAELTAPRPDEWADHLGLEDAPTTNRKTSSRVPSEATPDPSPVEQAWRTIVGDLDRVEYASGSRMEQLLDELQAIHPDRVQICEVKGTYTRPDRETVLKSDVLTALPTIPSEAVTVAELAQRIGWDENSVEGQLGSLPGVQRIDWTLSRDGWLLRDVFYRQTPVEHVRHAGPPDGGTLAPEERVEIEAMLAGL